MKKINWIADWFVSELPGGGAELADVAAMETLSKEYMVETIHSHDVTANMLNGSYKEDLWIVSNFVNMPKEIISLFADKGSKGEIKYIHYSHDHAYCKHRNPYRHGSEMKCDCNIRSVKPFLNEATAILCQTYWHKDIWDKNVQNPRKIAVGSNLWSGSTLDYMESLLGNSKSEEYFIFNSPYPHKNTTGAVNEANTRGLKYKLVGSVGYETFLKEISGCEGIIFMPLLAESLSRILVEARMCSCKIITNGLCGANKEEWFSLKGKDLVDYMRNKQPQRLLDIIGSLMC